MRDGVRSAEPQTPLTPLARQLAERLPSGTERINLRERALAPRYFAERGRQYLRRLRAAQRHVAAVRAADQPAGALRAATRGRGRVVDPAVNGSAVSARRARPRFENTGLAPAPARRSTGPIRTVCSGFGAVRRSALLNDAPRGCDASGAATVVAARGPVPRRNARRRTHGRGGCGRRDATQRRLPSRCNHCPPVPIPLRRECRSPKMWFMIPVRPLWIARQEMSGGVQAGGIVRVILVVRYRPHRRLFRGVNF